MRQAISLTLILSLGFPLALPLNPVFAAEIDQNSEILTAQRQRGGRGGRSVNRGGGANRTANRGGGGINRSRMDANGSGRVNRSNANRPNRSGGQQTVRRENMNLHEQRAGSNRVNRDQARNRTQNIDRDNVRNRAQNIDRDNVRNRVDNSRDFNLDNDRRYSNRINRNTINTGNRNVIVNPRGGWGGWGWNNGVAWRPNYGYWGSGFWGGFAAGAITAGVTAAVVSAATDNEPNYIIIEQNSPGYQLFDGYGLSQFQCIENGTLVYVYGPQDSLICATPNSLVPAGYYDVEPTDLTLIAR